MKLFSVMTRSNHLFALCFSAILFAGACGAVKDGKPSSELASSESSDTADGKSDLSSDKVTEFTIDDVKKLLIGTRGEGRSWTKDKIGGESATDHACSVTIADSSVKIHVGGPEDGRGLDYRYDISPKFFEKFRVGKKCPNAEINCPGLEMRTITLRAEEKPTALDITRELSIEANLDKKTLFVSIFSYQHIVLSSQWGGASCELLTL